MTATTDTESALLRMILADPPNDGPRLLLADALEERGECDRAEFVRVQCEIARLEALVQRWIHTPHDRPGGSAEDGGPAGAALAEAQSLHRRERELWSSVWESFVLVPGLVPYPAGTEHPSPGPASAAVARGLPATVRAPLGVLMGGPCVAVGPHHGDRCSGGRVQASNAQFTQRCLACAGTGRTPGTLAKLFAAAPIVAVEASDLQPTGPIEHGRQRGQWFYPRRDLPDDLWWWRLAPYSEGHPQVAVYYPTREDATRELSDELVRLGRSLAGLPKLEGRR